MTNMSRVAVTAILVAGWACAGSPPHAGAVTPPRVDDTYLPDPARPAPPKPTEQKDRCATAAVDPSRFSADTQVDTLALQSVWPLSTGAGQTVAVIDTGVARHPRLPRLRAGGDYVSTGDGTQDCDGHGTLVAGIVAAAPDAGSDSSFAGVAPDATIVTIRQSSSKFGRVRIESYSVGDVDTLAMAVRTAADLGASVINISTVACEEGGVFDRSLGAAVAYAVDVKDAVVVTAAGNVGAIGQCPQQNPPPDPRRQNEPDWDGVKVVVSPGWYDDYVLTVGSVGPDGTPSTFSLAGPWVDVAAPGEGVISLHPGKDGPVNAFPDGPDATGLKTIFGTSYAAPVVSGIAALVRSRFPRLSARQVMQRIEATAHHPAGGWDPYVGSGVVDAVAAVSDVPPEPRRQQQAIALPEPPPEPDTRGRATAFTGIAGCAAALAAVLALAVPTNRLARRRADDRVMRD